MKRFFSAVLALLLSISILLCSGCTPKDTDADKVQYDIITTVFPAYDFARAVAGDTLQIKMLLSPGSEAHGYTPTLDDLAAIQNCKLFIYTGGATDAWADEQFRSGNLDAARFTALAMTDCVSLKESATAIEEHTHDHDDHEHEEEFDEHVWTSPENAVTILNKICEELCALHPDHSAQFRTNTDTYIALIRTQEQKMQGIADVAANKMLVFEDRFPFVYFCDYFGLSHTSAFGSCGGNTEVSAATLDTLVKTIQDNNIPCILYLEFSKMTTADQIVAATGCEKREFHSYHNVTQEDFDNGVTYVDLMKRNTETLKEALS